MASDFIADSLLCWCMGGWYSSPERFCFLSEYPLWNTAHPFGLTLTAMVTIELATHCRC